MSHRAMVRVCLSSSARFVHIVVLNWMPFQHNNVQEKD